jgi:hypothetical protein
MAGLWLILNHTDNQGYDYRFSFAEEEFLEQNPDERLRQQFMDTPLWGKK